jgi:hypothetical protein
VDLLGVISKLSKQTEIIEEINLVMDKIITGHVDLL